MSKSQSTGIQIWFWPRHSTAIPPELHLGSTLTPNSRWGTPAANFTFVPGFCDYSRHFNAHQIVIDLTFCVRVFVCVCLLGEKMNALVF